MGLRAAIGWGGAALVVAAIALTWRTSRPASGASPAIEPASPVTAAPAPAQDEAARQVQSDPATDRDVAAAPVAVLGAGSAAPDPLEARLERVVETFRTDAPDFEGLVGLWDELAGEASVVAGSIDPGPPVTGRLAFGDRGLGASFTLEDDLCRIELTAPAAGDESLPLVLRSTRLSFGHAGDVAKSGSASVQFHPDTREPASKCLVAGEERLIGWSLRHDGTRARGSALSAALADDGRSWRVGRSESIAELPSSAHPDGRAEQALLDVVRGALR
jgi:hypothetical protein